MAICGLNINLSDIQVELSDKVSVFLELAPAVYTDLCSNSHNNSFFLPV